MCVLVVEDELLIRMNLAVTLEDAGHEVLCACNGTEAVMLDTMHPQRFSAVLSDFNMPGKMTGGDVIAHFRTSYPLIPMFIVTAVVAAVTPDFMERHGIGVIGKPYDAAKLVERLTLAITGQRSRSRLREPAQAHHPLRSPHQWNL